MADLTGLGQSTRKMLRQHIHRSSYPSPGVEHTLIWGFVCFLHSGDLHGITRGTAKHFATCWWQTSPEATLKLSHSSSAFFLSKSRHYRARHFLILWPEWEVLNKGKETEMQFRLSRHIKNFGEMIGIADCYSWRCRRTEKPFCALILLSIPLISCGLWCWTDSVSRQDQSLKCREFFSQVVSSLVACDWPRRECRNSADSTNENVSLSGIIWSFKEF